LYIDAEIHSQDMPENEKPVRNGKESDIIAPHAREFITLSVEVAKLQAKSCNNF